MTYWQVLGIFGLVLLGNLLEQAFGPLGPIVMLGGLLVLLAVLYVVEHVGIEGLARDLEAPGSVDTEQFLLVNENWHGRIDLAARLRRSLPEVPLRGDAEIYAFPRAHERICRGFIWFCVSMLVFVILSPFYNHPGAPDALTEMLPILSVPLLGGFAFWRFSVHARSIFVLTREGVWHAKERGATKSLRWTEIDSARDSHMFGGLVLRGAGVRISIPDYVVGYGRLANHIAAKVGDRYRIR